MSTSLQGAGARVAPQSLAQLSAQQIVEGYRTGRFTPRDVVDETIAALESADALCTVMATEMFASARAEAERAVKAWKMGEARALTGVPVTIKDLIYVAGTPASGGAPMLNGFVPGNGFGRGHGRQRSGRDNHLQDDDLRVRLQAHGR